MVRKKKWNKVTMGLDGNWADECNLDPAMKRDKHGYHQVIHGNPLVINPKTTELWLSCCDCGLTHRIDFKIQRGKIHYKIFVADKETKKLRS